jgi:hypothetical protein
MAPNEARHREEVVEEISHRASLFLEAEMEPRGEFVYRPKNLSRGEFTLPNACSKHLESNAFLHNKCPSLSTQPGLGIQSWPFGTLELPSNLMQWSISDTTRVSYYYLHPERGRASQKKKRKQL